SGDGQFRSPDGILVDAATGDIFVADRFLNRVQRLSVDAAGLGHFVMKWGTGTAGAPDEMHGPVGLARDSIGAIYVAEHGDIPTLNGGNFVSKYTLGSGNTVTRVFRNGNSFNTPYGIAVNGSQLLISDGFNSQIQYWNLNGSPTGSVSIPGTIVIGLSIDAAGNLWVVESSDGGNGAIERVEKRNASTGALAGLSWGTLGSGNGQFHLPFHAVVNTATNLAYVSDYWNDRVQVFDLSSGVDVTPPTVATFTVGTNTSTVVNFNLT